jgi:hypothetical protein
MSIEIRAYHDTSPIFYNLDEEDSLSESDHAYQNTLYFGAEVETDDPSGGYQDPDEDDDEDSERTPEWNDSSLERNLDRCGFLEYFTPTHDGSLHNGAEFVSHAFTLEAWHFIQDSVTQGFRALLNAGLRAHDTTTCGLHIHVSRNFFTSEEAISNLIIFVEKNWYDLTIFARRKESTYARRPLNTSSCTLSRDSFEEYIIKQDKKLYAKFGTERYAAVNLRNSNTIEFRFFKGTLNPVTFYATLQFISNLIHLMNEISILQAFSTSIQDVLSYRKYPELEKYVATRKFGFNKEPQIPTQE